MFVIRLISFGALGDACTLVKVESCYAGRAGIGCSLAREAGLSAFLALFDSTGPLECSDWAL